MDTPQGESIVRADNIAFSYGSRQVITGLTLSISAGEIFGLLGANGAGHPPHTSSLASYTRCSGIGKSTWTLVRTITSANIATEYFATRLARLNS